jgi:hypothetical protein
MGDLTLTWRSAADFAVKLVHSLVFLSIAASVLHIFYAGITDRISRWTKIALTIALGESLVFAFAARSEGWPRNSEPRAARSRTSSSPLVRR